MPDDCLANHPPPYALTLPGAASVMVAGVPRYSGPGVPASSVCTVPFQVADSVGVDVGGGGGGGVSVFAMRKSALPFDDVSSVQKPMKGGSGSSPVVKDARTFVKSPDRANEAKTSRIRV